MLGLGLGLGKQRPPGGGSYALYYEGADSNDNSAGVNCGVTGLGWATADLAAKVKAKIRRGRTGVVEVIAGKSGDTNPTLNYLLWIAGPGSGADVNKLCLAVMNSVGGIVQAVGTTQLQAGVNYDVEGEWTGTNLNVKVNGVQQGTQPAITLLQAPDGTTPFCIGREIPFNAATGENPYPFQGYIVDVEVWRAGTLRGRWPSRSLSSGGLVLDNSGNNRNGTRVGTPPPVLHTSPF